MRRLAALGVATAVACTLATGAPGTSRQVRVAYVTDVAALPNPHDLRGAALLGFKRAVKTFRVDARVVQFNPREGAAPTLALLAAHRYDLIIVGEVRTRVDLGEITAVPRRFPGTKFMLADPPTLAKWPRNVQGSIWRVEQPAFLAGYLAALMERRRAGKDVVGSVGGFKIDTLDTFIAGFEAGAKRADPQITTLRSYTNSFLNPVACTSAGLGQIARGAGTLFNVAGTCGLGTLEAAKTKGVWGVGVDVDQSFLGPHVLTSVLKRFDVQAYDTVEALIKRKLRTGGNMFWDLRNGAVGLGPISPRVPKSILSRLDGVRRQMVAGSIRVPDSLEQR